MIGRLPLGSIFGHLKSWILNPTRQRQHGPQNYWRNPTLRQPFNLRPETNSRAECNEQETSMKGQAACTKAWAWRVSSSERGPGICSQPSGSRNSRTIEEECLTTVYGRQTKLHEPLKTNMKPKGSLRPI